MSDPMAVADLLDLALSTVNAVFQADGISLPERQYIYAGDQGETVHDCEQVTVSLAQLYSGEPGNQAGVPSRCESPVTAVLLVEIVRCVPAPAQARSGKPQPIDPVALSAQARIQAADAYLLMQSAYVLGHDFLGAIAEVSAGPVSGGYQAMILNVAVAVP